MLDRDADTRDSKDVMGNHWRVLKTIENSLRCFCGQWSSKIDSQLWYWYEYNFTQAGEFPSIHGFVNILLVKTDCLYLK